MNKNNEVIEFIERRFGNHDQSWQNGNCYYFAVILKTRFPEGKIVYDPVDNHFLFKYKNKLYDSNGIDKRSMKKVQDWDTYKEFDALDYYYVIKDCII